MSGWHWPQYVFAMLYAISLMVDANRHGKERVKRENVWITIAATIGGVLILHFGGFW